MEKEMKNKRHRQWKRRIVDFIWGLLSFLLLWEVLYLTVKNHTIPSPYLTFLYLPKIGDKLGYHLLASLARVGAAVLLSLFIGIPAGIALSTSRRLRKVFSPFVYFVYPIPKVAFLPVFMLLFGLGNLSKILLLSGLLCFRLSLQLEMGQTRYQRFIIKLWQATRQRPLKCSVT